MTNSEHEQAVLVVYDIPQSVGFPNPSGKLRSRGIRINLSCWIIPETRVPWALIEEMECAGVSVETVRFAESERDNLIRLAKNAIASEMGRVKAAFEKSVADAEKKIVDVSVVGLNGGTQSPEEKRAYRIKKGMQRAKRALVAAKEAAIAFDLLGDIEELIDGTTEAVKAEFDAAFATPVKSETEQPALFA